MNTQQHITLKPYDPCLKATWDAAVQASRNGTFLHQRDYMDYHARRFKDASLMCYKGNRLVALFPCNLTDGTCYSHQGLTYGGLLMLPEAMMNDVAEALEEIAKYFAARSCRQIIYRAIPSIYHRNAAEEDLYQLHRMGAVLSGRSASTTIVQGQQQFSKLRTRLLHKAILAGLHVAQSHDYPDFWPVLEENLMSRHHVRPVHTLDEMVQLSRHFRQHIHLFNVYDNRHDIVAGCIVYETDTVAHAQYIASTATGRRWGATSLLFHHLLNEVYAEKPFFDLGISTEQEGRVLNEGLQRFKESLGGRTTVYDTYTLKLT